MGLEAWTTMPPPQYWGEASAHVSYLERPALRTWCTGDGEIACYHHGLNIVFMPVQCSPTGRQMAQPETVDVGRLVREDMSYCGSLKAHEFGHVNSWRH